MQGIVLIMSVLLLAGCYDNPAGLSVEDNNQLTKQYDLVSILQVQPPLSSAIHIGDHLSLIYRFHVPSAMLPAHAGVVYIHEDGADGVVRYSYIPFVKEGNGWQEEQVMYTDDEKTIEFMRGHEINAMYFISQPDLTYPDDPYFILGYSPPEPGNIYSQDMIRWDRVVYKKFIPLHYRLAP